jgi:Cu2+-containing amine oxidase
MATTDTAPALPHPLSMLTADEIRAAAAIFQRERQLDSVLYSSITLREPTKHELSQFDREHAALPRRVDIVAAMGPDTLAEAVVDLSADALESYREVEGVRPAIIMEEVVNAVFALYRIRGSWRRWPGAASTTSDRCRWTRGRPARSAIRSRPVAASRR